MISCNYFSWCSMYNEQFFKVQGSSWIFLLATLKLQKANLPSNKPYLRIGEFPCGTMQIIKYAMRQGRCFFAFFPPRCHMANYLLRDHVRVSEIGLNLWWLLVASINQIMRSHQLVWVDLQSKTSTLRKCGSWCPLCPFGPNQPQTQQGNDRSDMV